MEKRKISIEFTQNDLQDLLDGETFDWEVDGIEVHLYRDDFDYTVCSKCKNPETMYWCSKCEANHEEETCPACGGQSFLDTRYHLHCN